MFNIHYSAEGKQITVESFHGRMNGVHGRVESFHSRMESFHVRMNGTHSKCKKFKIPNFILIATENQIQRIFGI